jgi:hypothetical protein
MRWVGPYTSSRGHHAGLHNPHPLRFARSTPQLPYTSHPRCVHTRTNAYEYAPDNALCVHGRTNAYEYARHPSCVHGHTNAYEYAPDNKLCVHGRTNAYEYAPDNESHGSSYLTTTH